MFEQLITVGELLINGLSIIPLKRDIQTILSVKVPQISPLRFLLFAKGSQVKFCLEEIYA